ncbi:MAG TPA: TonB-dependent receptor [Candidatus Acidoferrales bacterium]|nr:TonB-dependent receptor [Candidatus Acidoferrales bacterium]
MRSQKNLMWGLLPCLALGFLSVFSGVLPARGQGVGAEISGTVTDATGAALAGAKVTLTDQATGVTRVVTAGSDGHYVFPDLPNGTYSLKFDQAGFASAEIHDIVLNIGTNLTRDVQMKVGAVQQQVTVEAQGAPIDTTKSEVAGLVSLQQINNMPINSRQYLNLALLMPGTSQDASRPYYNNVAIGAGVTFYGNGFFVDGVRNTWAEQGEPRQDIPEGAVAEFKVYTTQFPADLGLAEGGFVTVVSKSGTNQFHGDIFEYWRNERLNALNKFQTAQQKSLGLKGFPFNRNQFGADLGGPVIKNRTHFFASFERTRTNDSLTVFTGLPQFYSSVEGTFAKPSWRTLWLARGDQKISNNQTMFVRYAGEREYQDCFNCGGSAAVNAGFSQKIPRTSIVFGDTWMKSARLLNDFRFQYAFSEYEIGSPAFPIWTAFGQYPPARLNELQTVLSFPSLTWGANFQELGPEHRYGINDDVTSIHGTHELHFGTEYDYIPYKDDSPGNLTGRFTFGKDQLFDPNNPTIVANLQNPIQYTQTLPPINDELNTSYWGWYVMDNWRALPRLNVNYGLRYDRQFGSFNENFNPATLPQALPFANYSKRGDTNNFGPRLGLSWDVTGAGKSIVRAGFGQYYNNIRTLITLFAEPRDLLVCSIIINKPSYPDPFGGKSPSSFCSTAPPNITELENNFVNPYSQQFNGGFTQQLTDTLSVNVDGVYVHSLRDYRDVDVNFNPANPSVRPLPQWGQIILHEPISKGDYKAMYLRFEKRYSHRYQYLVSYTLSDCKDNNPAGRVANLTNPNLDWGPCSIDRRNALVASGSFQLPWQVIVAGVFSLRSTLPFSAFSNTFIDGARQYVPGTTRDQGNRDLNLGTVNAYRSTLGLAPIPSSQINSSRLNDFDIRVSKAIPIKGERQLQVSCQVFNLFNTTNLPAPFTSGQVNVAAASSFGEILTAQPGTQAELSVRFVF